MTIDADVGSFDVSTARFFASMSMTFGLVMSCAYLVQWPSLETTPPFHWNQDGDQDELKSYQGDGDVARNALRYAAWNSAKELHREPCNHAAKQRYIEAATAYVRARNAMAPCLITKTCGPSDQMKLASSARTFRTELDERLSEAMADVHAHTVFDAHDFPVDVLGNVASLPHDPNLSVGLPPPIERAGAAAQCS